MRPRIGRNIFSMKNLAWFQSLLFLSTAFGWSGVRLNIEIGPGFYTTGDYDTLGKEVSLDFSHGDRKFGAGLSFYDFTFNKDAYATPYRLFAKTVEGYASIEIWSRGYFKPSLVAGYTFQWLNREDYVFQAWANEEQKDYLQRKYENFISAPADSLSLPASDYTFYAYRKDPNGYYRITVTEKRQYSLHGFLLKPRFDFVHKMVTFRIAPAMRWYPSEPLFIWSLGFGIGASLW